MKIAVLSPVWFPVPPTRYGGIEWIVSLLAEGLVRAGHEVSLFASGDSSTQAELVSVYDEAPSEKIGTTQVELRHALSCFERADEFDVVNDHTGPLGAMLGGVVIGDHAVIGANAVVISDVPAHAVAVGVPAVVKPRRRESALPPSGRTNRDASSPEH